MADILVANTAFHAHVDDGDDVFVAKGTTFREGHPLTKGRDELFAPLVVDYEYTPPVKAAAQAVTRKFGGGS